MFAPTLLTILGVILFLRTGWVVGNAGLGGAVGIPLYLSQTLVIAPYLFGFRDGWLRIFPDHPALLVDLVAFAAIVGIAVVSARFSFRVQYLILALIGVAVASMALGAFSGGPGRAPVWWGRFSGAVETGLAGTDFWGVFAVFFPQRRASRRARTCPASWRTRDVLSLSARYWRWRSAWSCTSARPCGWRRR